MKKKDIKEYQENYGNIPNDFFDRFKLLLKRLNLSDRNLKEIRTKLRGFMNLKWEKVGYVICFYPKASPRPRLSGQTKRFYVSEAKSNNDSFKKFCNECAIDTFITTPCRILIETYHKMPSNLSKVDTILAELKLIRPISRPDWDNLGKTYSDMIQNNVILDDSLIVDGREVKYYSIKPRVEIRIEYMTKYDSKYNKKKIESWGTYIENVDRIKERDSI